MSFCSPRPILSRCAQKELGLYSMRLPNSVPDAATHLLHADEIDRVKLTEDHLAQFEHVEDLLCAWELAKVGAWSHSSDVRP